MSKVTSTKTVSFPSLNWGIHAGEVRELPSDKDARKAVLAHPAISETKKEASEEAPESSQSGKST